MKQPHPPRNPSPRAGQRPGWRALGVATLLAAWLVSAAAVRPARAQTTGNLSGTVFDQTGQPLRGITIEVSSPTQIGGARTTVTSDEGRFRFPQLMVGVFKLKASAPGLRSYVQEGISLTQGKSLDLDIILEVETSVIEVQVVQKKPLIDTSSARVGSEFDREFLDQIPLGERSYQGVATLAPGVVDSTGTGNPSMMGGSYFNNTYNVDGFDTTDPVSHTFGQNFSFNAIAAEQVQTAAFGVENSATTGGVINVVSKSGSNRLEAAATSTYTDEHLRLFTDRRDRSNARSADLSLDIGGPIIKDRVWFFASGQLTNGTGAVPRDPTGQLPDHAPISILGFDGFIKLTWQANPRHKLELKSFVSVADFRNVLQDPLTENEAEARQYQRSTFNSLQWHGIITDSVLANVGAAFQETFLDIGPMSCLFDKDCLNKPSEFDVATGISRRNYSSRDRDSRRRFQSFGHFTWLKDTKNWGSHQIRLGARWDIVSNPSATTTTGDQLNYVFGAEKYARTEVCVNDPRVSGGDCHQGWLRSVVGGRNGLLYLADQWKITRYFQISPQLGLHHGSSDNDLGSTITNFWVFTPQLAMSWDATHDGRTRLSASYGQLVDTGFLALARFSGRRTTDTTCFWDENIGGYTGNCRVSGGDNATTVGLPCGPDGFNADGTRCDTKLRPPLTHEYVLGGEREVVTGMVVGVDAVYRRANHQWEDIETNALWNQGGSKIREDGGFKNGRNQFIYDLETPDAARRRFLSITPSFRKREGRLKALASYTWRRSVGTSNNSFQSNFLDNPGQAAYFYGPLPEDIRHNIKLQASYQVRSWLTLGMSYDFFTGGPYNRYFRDSEFQSYSRFKAKRGYDSLGNLNPDDDRPLRMPDISMINLKILSNLKPLIGHSVEIFADVLNVLALRTTTGLIQRDGPFFQYEVRRMSPLTIRLGLGYRY